MPYSVIINDSTTKQTAALLFVTLEDYFKGVKELSGNQSITVSGPVYFPDTSAPIVKSVVTAASTTGKRRGRPKGFSPKKKAVVTTQSTNA